MLYHPEMDSHEFRKTYTRLTETTVVTAYGKPIGTWVPNGANLGAAASAKTVSLTSTFGAPRPAPKPKAKR